MHARWAWTAPQGAQTVRWDWPAHPSEGEPSKGQCPVVGGGPWVRAESLGEFQALAPRMDSPKRPPGRREGGAALSLRTDQGAKKKKKLGGKQVEGCLLLMAVGGLLSLKRNLQGGRARHLLLVIARKGGGG